MLDATPYEDLANAIVARAAKDYLWALKKLKRQPKHTKALEYKAEVEKFFRTKWYELLTGVDADFLLERLKKEAENDSEGIFGEYSEDEDGDCL